MARGFESKDVEYQQAEAERSARRAAPISDDERRRSERRRTVELALIRARADLALAIAPHHRQMLIRAIADLETQLSHA
jgi:hypothetical protein